MRTPGILILLTILALLIGCPSEDPDGAAADDDVSTDDDLDGDGFTSDEGDCDDTDASIHPGAEEVCNGEDEDCDGFVDEDYPDSDLDGIADCIDDACDVELPDYTEIGTVADCPWVGTVHAANPWDIVEEWHYPISLGGGPIVRPAIGPMTGDNDGTFPGIIFTSYGYDTDPDTDPDANRLIALHGDGSGAFIDLPGMLGAAGVVLADVDLDGEVEIITLRDEFYCARVVAISATGQDEWESELLCGSYPIDSYPELTVADINGDGSVEVIVADKVLKGSDGLTLFTLPELDAFLWTPVVADLDGDGTAEIIAGTNVYSHAGVIEWTTVSHYGGLDILFAAVADLDGDAGGEVVFVSGSVVTIHDDDGTVLGEYDVLPGDMGRPPAIADFDGDGEPEIAVPSGSYLVVMETDGTLLWTSPTQEDSCCASCSAFDFDADGAYELLYADEYDFRIHDGTTGAPLYLWEGHDSTTVFEYPVVADVDRDGSAEIVVACNESPDNLDVGLHGHCRGITVLGHADNAWPPAGPSWAIHDYAPFRVAADGHVASPTPWWLYNNMFRARPPGDGAPDLIPIEGDLCVASCEDGPINVSWGIANQGLADPATSVFVAFYSLDDSGAATLLDVQQVNGTTHGQQQPGGSLGLTPDQWGDGLRIVVDDDGTGVGSVDECDEGNNVLEILELICE